MGQRRYPDRPIVGVAGIVRDGDAVLLIRRGRAPQQGLWSLPGGALEVGETINRGLRREIREETGLEVQVGPLVEVVERILHDQDSGVEYHYVLLDYLCSVDGGALEAGDDASAAAWFDHESLDGLDLTAGTSAVIEKAFRIRDPDEST